MGIIMLVMGKIKPVQIIFYLVAAVVFTVYTLTASEMTVAKKQVKDIVALPRSDMKSAVNDEGIQVEFAGSKETYEWEQIQQPVDDTKDNWISL